jgi:hypothetical protein
MQHKLAVLTAAFAVAATSAVGVTAAAPLPPAPVFTSAALVDGGLAGPVSIGDVDGDGAPDLVTPDVAVHLGNGDGTFLPVRRYAPGGTGGALAVVVGDTNGDAAADLAVTDLLANGVRVLPGPLPVPRLAGVPEPVPGTTLHATGHGPASLRIGDLDHQGPLDLVVGNSDDDTVSVLLADGTGGFHRTDYPAPNAAILPHAALALADVDGSGDVDIVVADRDTNVISVLRADAGGGTFQPAITFGSDVLSRPVAVALGELDGDSVQDLVVAQQHGVDVFLGNGDATFEPQDPALLPDDVRSAPTASVELSDLNRDGRAEIVVGPDGLGGPVRPGQVDVLVRRHDGTFTRLVAGAFGDGSTAFWNAVGDLDLDGRPDVAVTNEGVWTLLNRMGPRTAAGSAVVVVPFDPETGATPVTITFNEVSQAGDTTAEFDEIEEQFVLQTTAQFDVAEVCFTHSGAPVPTIARFDQPTQSAPAAWRIPPQHDTGDAICAGDTAPLHTQWVVVETTGSHTPTGSPTVNPFDPTTGRTPVTITFTNVTVAGDTKVTSASTGPAVPSGFRLGSAYYELTTDAVFDGLIEVCFAYPGPVTPAIVHWVSGMPVIEPITRDTGTEVCADVESLSPFALVVPDNATDTTPPVVSCRSADTVWHAENVSKSCGARDDESGLAQPADAAFSLSTSVPDGTEDANALTATRQVCDRAGNCATAGPVAGNKIDRKAPALTIPSGITADATSPNGATVTFAASATDGVDPKPVVTCAPAAGSVLPIGSTTVACGAVDFVGNTAQGSFTVTVAGAADQITRLIQDVLSASQLPPSVTAQLLARLQPIVDGFDPTNPAHRRAACTALRLFTTALRLLSGRGLPPVLAARWTADANTIRAVIGC